MYRDIVHVCIVVSVSQGCAFHIHYAAALHRVNNTIPINHVFFRGTRPAQLQCVLLLCMSRAVASMCHAVRLFTFAIRCYLIPLTVKLSM